MTSANPKDLEVIVTMLEIAAIYLTPEVGSRFTREALFAQANEIAGPKLQLDERDLRIVLPFMKSLQRHPGRLYSLR